MNHKTFRAALAALLLAAGGAALAYPDKPVTLVHGFAAGGNADVIARIVADGLGRELGQPVVVESRTGAGGNIASGQVARTAPDGHTLILLTGGHAVSAAVYRKLAFDPVEDFDWLSVVTKFPFVIATRKDAPFNDLAELVAAARKAPGSISFSSVGVGSTQHLSGELLQSMAGITLIHVPYRGGAAPLQDVLGGRVDVMFDSVTVTRAQAEAGRLKALAVTSPAPIPQLPGVPPAARSVPGYEVMSWTGIAAPRGLPPAVAAQLHKAIVRVLADSEVARRLDATGGTPSPSASGEEMKRFVQAQVGQWNKVVADSAIPQQ